MFTLNEEIKTAVSKANGTRRQRVLSQKDVEIFLQVLNDNADNENIHTVRRYSGDGFVPNSYKYQDEISYIEAYRSGAGEWRIYATTTEAKRSRGAGALTTINGRAAE